MSGIHFMLGNYACVEGAWLQVAIFLPDIQLHRLMKLERCRNACLVVGHFFKGKTSFVDLCHIWSLVSWSKAMTATASAGYNYMQEGIGYAVAVEAHSGLQRCRGENFATK